MINQQSAAWSTSSTKQHKLICQLRTNTTACTWPANDHSNGVRDHSNNRAQRLYFSKESSRGKKTPNDAIPGRMYASHWFLPWILSTYYDLPVAQLLDYFSLVFRVENVFPVFWYTLPTCHKICHRHQTCVCRASLCVVLLVRTCITCTRVQTMSICPNLYNTTLEAPGTQPFAMLLCGFLGGSSSRNHYYPRLVLVMRALATSISMYVCSCTYRNSINKCTTIYDIYRSTMGIFLQ